MAFQRIDLLPRYSLAERQKTQSRWEDDDGTALREKVLELIRKGAGEDFLQWEFENGQLRFLEDQWDLAGIRLFTEEIEFPTDDNFEAIDFSYAQFWHCTFTGATFPQTRFAFARLYNVEFRKCLFAFAHFYGTTFEKCKFVDCDFAEENSFLNCDISDTTFQNCFFEKNSFVECKFDETVSFEVSGASQIGGVLARPSSGFHSPLHTARISGIHRGIKEGFLAGQIYSKARRFLFLQQQAYTRFNRVGLLEKSKAYIWEATTGYGIRPARVLICLIMLFAVVFFWFAHRLESLSDSLVLSAGAFLTFGAKADLLEKLSLFDHLVYIASAFSGVALVALFITVMANVLLKDN